MLMLHLYVHFRQLHIFMYLVFFSPGIGPVHMNEVVCSGFEKSLTECFFNRDALGCSHEEDVAVRCNVPAMGFQNRVSTFFLWYTLKTLTFV